MRENGEQTWRGRRTARKHGYHQTSLSRSRPKPARARATFPPPARGGTYAGSAVLPRRASSFQKRLGNGRWLKCGTHDQGRLTDVARADLFGDLNVRAVNGAEEKTAV